MKLIKSQKVCHWRQTSLVRVCHMTDCKMIGVIRLLWLVFCALWMVFLSYPLPTDEQLPSERLHQRPAARESCALSVCCSASGPAGGGASRCTAPCSLSHSSLSVWSVCDSASPVLAPSSERSAEDTSCVTVWISFCRVWARDPAQNLGLSSGCRSCDTGRKSPASCRKCSKLSSSLRQNSTNHAHRTATRSYNESNF